MMPPGMSIDQTTVGGLATRPDLGRGQAREHAGRLIVQMMDSVAEGKGPEITLIVFGPPKGKMNHHCPSSRHSGLDAVLSNGVVMVATDTAMLDPLAFAQQLGNELFAGANTFVSTTVIDTETNGCSYFLELELGLICLCASKTDLVNNGDFATGSIAEETTSTELLRGERVTAAGEL
jgi:hypothetical protein